MRWCTVSRRSSYALGQKQRGSETATEGQGRVSHTPGAAGALRAPLIAVPVLLRAVVAAGYLNPIGADYYPVAGVRIRARLQGQHILPPHWIDRPFGIRVHNERFADLV